MDCSHTVQRQNWWSKWEVLKQAFGDVKHFLENSDLPPTRQKLMDIFNDPSPPPPPPPPKTRTNGTSITIDFGEPFVKATYNLEGDGPLALSAYEEIAKLKAVILTQHFPNTNATATKLFRMYQLMNNN